MFRRNDVAVAMKRGSCWLWAVVAVAACGSPSNGNGTAARTQESAPAPVKTAIQESAPVSADSATKASPGGGEELVLASAAPVPATGSAPARYQPGQDYKVLSGAQGTSSSPEKIEVAEVFWYGCPHCYNLDPRLQDWAKKLPADVSFVRVPVMWSAGHQLHARMFYTAQALNKMPEMHDAIFHEIHVGNNPLNTDEQIQALFQKFGVSAEDFQKNYRSFTVEGQLRRAKELTQRYEIRSVPVLVVNGKFTTDAPGIKSYDDMFAVMNELIAKERQRK